MVFNNWFRLKNREIYNSIYRNIFADEYAFEADPDGYVTMTDLKNFVNYLETARGGRIVDLGSGRGGPGMWIARALEVGYYLGIEITPGGVETANKRINDFKLKGIAHFQLGDVTSLPFLSDNYFNGVISIDTLSFIRDVQAVINETARILKKGAKFVFTSWEMDLSNRINDYHPILSENGFEVEKYEETSGWKQRQRESYISVLAKKEEIIQELGEEVTQGLFREAEKKLPRIDKMRRIFVVAIKV